jgi:hypothetical protein
MPDVSQQRAVPGQVVGNTAKVAPLSLVRLVASLPKHLVSHLLADGQGESVPESLLQGAIALPCSALIPRAGSVVLIACLLDCRAANCCSPTSPPDNLAAEKTVHLFCHWSTL